jgi:hypothetical protein
MSDEAYEINSKRELRCFTCKTITFHELKYIHRSRYIDDDEYDPIESIDDPSYREFRQYRLWACAGCGSGRLEIYVDEVSTSYGEEGPVQSYSFFYPNHRIGKLEERVYFDVPDGLQTIYRETINSYNAGLGLLCGIGLRSVLEGICRHLGIHVGGLEDKLESLVSEQHLTEDIVDGLYKIKIIGDSAVHELQKPKDYELKFAIAAIEELLYHLFEKTKLEDQITNLRIVRQSEFKALIARANSSRNKRNKRT